MLSFNAIVSLLDAPFNYHSIVTNVIVYNNLHMAEDLSTSGEEAANRLISLTEAASLSGFSQGHLRLLAKQKKIWATKIGRDWVTTEESIRDYLATERRTGPKPRANDD